MESREKEMYKNRCMGCEKNRVKDFFCIKIYLMKYEFDETKKIIFF